MQLKGVLGWVEYRLPWVGLLNNTVGYNYPTPRNLNYWWNFGSLAGLALVIEILTGVVLNMHYVPTAEGAFASVERIMRDVNFGWLIRYVHANGASVFFAVIYLHMFRSFYYGSYKNPRELVWWLGLIIFLLMIITAFTGYVLPWGQMSFWAATVITNLASAIPVVGTDIVQWLWGDFSVGNSLLGRFNSLHYALPVVIVGVAIIHIWALHEHKSNNPLGIDVKAPRTLCRSTPISPPRIWSASVCSCWCWPAWCSMPRTCWGSPTITSRPTRCKRRPTSCRNGICCRSTPFCAPSPTSWAG